MNYHATKSLTRLNIANLTLGEEISFKERLGVQTQQVIGRASGFKASQFLEKRREMRSGLVETAPLEARNAKSFVLWLQLSRLQPVKNPEPVQKRWRGGRPGLLPLYRRPSVRRARARSAQFCC
jgi:hypothetical protein